MGRHLLYVAAACGILACAAGSDEGDEEFANDADPAAEADVAAAAETDASADPTPAATRPSIVRRHADITITISGSQSHDGTYRASGRSRMCGFMDDMLGQPTNNYTVQFPFEETEEITDVTLQAENVQDGATNRYYVNVGVRRGQRQPPGFVVRAGQTGSTDTGTARVTVAGDTSRVELTGQRGGGGRLEMTAVCAGPGEMPA